MDIQQHRYGRFHLLLAALALGGVQCSSESILIVNLDATNVPAGVTSLVLQALLNGTAGVEQPFPLTQRRLAVYIPPGSSGTVDMNITGVDGNGCRTLLGEDAETAA